ncbi:hypothetical protein [Xanthobacter autotrophicus]|uniref:hypothetical protein n=1 Tax=Xanthobacter autotrophicus TaxID=280 RepID=UPI00372A9580
MEDDDDFGGVPCDVVCERVQAIRNIAMDLETITDRKARDLLLRAGELALQHLALKSATVLELASEDGRIVKGRPL